MFRNYLFLMISIFLAAGGVPVLFPAVAGAAETGGVEGVLTINSKPVSRAVVYLEHSSGGPPPKPMTLTINQKDKAFNPDWAVVTVGSTLLFENHDEVVHNVKSVSKGNRFDLGAHIPGTVKTVVLKKTGPVLLRCRIHDNMKAFIFVSSTPYFFPETGSDGRFKLTGVPKGAYRLIAWHPRLTGREIEAGAVTVNVSSGTVKANLVLHAKAPAGADLTEVEEQDWSKVVDQIGKGLDEAVGLWKRGKSSSAMLRVLTTHSRIFGGSGLSKAIGEHLGKSKVEEHDRRFNAVIKKVQKEKPGPVSEKSVRAEIDRLIRRLREDIGKLPQSR
jgi:plastocyanin